MSEAELTRRLEIAAEVERQLRARIAALCEGPDENERLALRLHLAFRRAAEIPQIVAWPAAAQQAWRVLYEAVVENECGLGLLAKELEKRA